jgi:hypothetical protein
MVAVGAVTVVPLGPNVAARIPADLIERAASVFRERDPEFHFAEWPVELSSDRRVRSRWIPA